MAQSSRSLCNQLCATFRPRTGFLKARMSLTCMRIGGAGCSPGVCSPGVEALGPVGGGRDGGGGGALYAAIKSSLFSSAPSAEALASVASLADVLARA